MRCIKTIDRNGQKKKIDILYLIHASIMTKFPFVEYFEGLETF